MVTVGTNFSMMKKNSTFDENCKETVIVLIVRVHGCFNFVVSSSSIYQSLNIFSVINHSMKNQF